MINVDNVFLLTARKKTLIKQDIIQSWPRELLLCKVLYAGWGVGWLLVYNHWSKKWSCILPGASSIRVPNFLFTCTELFPDTTPLNHANHAKMFFLGTTAKKMIYLTPYVVDFFCGDIVHCATDRNNWCTINLRFGGWGGGQGCNFTLHETLIFSTLEMVASIRPMLVKQAKIINMFFYK